MDFFKNLDLNFAQAQCLCRGMYALAKSDGLHDREEMLIREFHDACRPAGGASYQDTVKGDFRIEDAADLFRQKEHRHMFIKTLWLLAFADGKVTAPEREKIASWAKALGVSAEDTEELHIATKEYLLGQLSSRIRNTEALAQVSKELKVI
jgi:uncharacterized membrane protein YebE (DUF533 family)